MMGPTTGDTSSAFKLEPYAKCQERKNDAKVRKRTKICKNNESASAKVAKWKKSSGNRRTVVMLTGGCLYVSFSFFNGSLLMK